jgi:hypothetical protein
MRILGNARTALAEYDARCLHYNLIADGIYRARREFSNPFDSRFTPYIIAGLIGFDMGRMMGKGDRYQSEAPGFAAALRRALPSVESALRDFVNESLDTCDIPSREEKIKRAYEPLCHLSSGSAHKGFHVGATKILHWIAPELFIMLDRNVAEVFRLACEVEFKKSTQPGYSSDKYVKCLTHAQAEVKEFGATNLRNLQEGTPLARLFDKVAFARPWIMVSPTARPTTPDDESGSGVEPT